MEQQGRASERREESQAGRRCLREEGRVCELGLVLEDRFPVCLDDCVLQSTCTPTRSGVPLSAATLRDFSFAYAALVIPEEIWWFLSLLTGR
jgi:hypothetical protein